MREEQLKNRIAKEFFGTFDCTEIIGGIDFAVKAGNGEYLLWAEAKRSPTDIPTKLTQLVLTIGKARTFDEHLPPPFLGCFDSNEIAFVHYADIQHIFYQNDFNWNVAPSDYKTREFEQVRKQIEEILSSTERRIPTGCEDGGGDAFKSSRRDASFRAYIFDLKKDKDELRQFIRENFIAGKTETSKLRINKHNFINVYSKWLDAVKPTIQISDWEVAKREGFMDGDFFLADLLSAENKTLKEKLFVLLKSDHYQTGGKKNHLGFFEFMQTGFSDGQKAHAQFWAKYERPPAEEYWDYIIDRRDLLVPQDVRERKGSFYTPRVWVELSQEYIADVLGDDWQDEYTVWDCAAGTGNLLAGLTNKYNIWASTLDTADVDVMKDRIRNGANLLEDHVFQFDFLNDDFSKLPKDLRDIISDEKQRRKLIIYINPPYAEASNKRTFERGVKGNRGVEQSAMNQKYAAQLGQGNAELFAQFLIRIYSEINGAVLAHFSKLKILSGPHFADFRTHFLAKLKKAFICPANTFDNVKGSFPIGFMIWDTAKKEKFKKINTTVYDKNGNRMGKKAYFSYDNSRYINDWIKPFRGEKGNKNIGKFPFKGSDFQNQNMIIIVNPEMEYNTEAGQFLIDENNLIVACIYFAVRKVIPANWLNDRDQFLYPNSKWEKDDVFKNDCLTYALFSNNIQSQHGTNHWIPFTEHEVSPRGKFKSHFMTDFIAGKVGLYMMDDEVEDSLFPVVRESRTTPLIFSKAAQKVFDAGRELWRYYHEQPKSNPNASLYDIREHFQGRNDNGKMNATSSDAVYTHLIGKLRSALKALASKIEPKVYEYGFLKE